MLTKRTLTFNDIILILQEALNNAMKRLEDAKQVDTMFTENAKQTKNSRFSSRVDLDMAIAEVNKKVEDAISNKQFGEASNYQAELDELESLRSTLPSIEEMENQLKELKAEIDSAIEGKNFKKAELLHEEFQLDKLEAKIEDEKRKLPKSSPSELVKTQVEYCVFSN